MGNNDWLLPNFDTTDHSLLLIKLNAYGFSRISFKLMQDYLCNKNQRSSINGSFRDWTEVITGVPQGSILNSVLFNIFLNDIFNLWFHENHITLVKIRRTKLF